MFEIRITKNISILLKSVLFAYELNEDIDILIRKMYCFISLRDKMKYRLSNYKKNGSVLLACEADKDLDLLIIK